MASQIDNGGVGTSVTAFTDQWVQSPMNVPGGRVAYSGNTPALITAMRAYAAGRGAGRNISLSFNGVGGTAAFGVGSAGSAQDTGFQGCNIPTYGGAFTFRISSDGSFYFGRGGSGTSDDNNGTHRSDGAIFGSILWSQAPSEPGLPTLTPGGTTMGVAWSTPADDGGQAINGYRVYYWKTGEATDAHALDVGVTNSATLTGLTAGATYFVRVVAKNAVTAAILGEFGPPSALANAATGAAPSAPQTPAAAVSPGTLSVTWTTPASTGGVPITNYRVDYGTDNTFATYTSVLIDPSKLGATITGLTPNTTQYARVVAINSVGTSPASTTVSGTIPARTVLDIVDSGALTLADGTQVELRSDGANSPAVTLVSAPFASTATFTAIATIPTNAGAGTFATPGGPRNLSLAADPAGNLYVIGTDAASPSVLLIKRYGRATATTWNAPATLSQALTSTGDPIVTVASTYVPGTGGSPVPTILVLARRAGTIGSGAISYATLDLTALTAGTGSSFLTSGNDPSWLGAPPTGTARDTASLDVAPLVSGGTRVGMQVNGWAIVDVTNGVVGGVAKAADGTTVAGRFVRVIGVNATTLAVLTVTSGGALAWSFISSGGSVLGSGSYSGANTWGGAFLGQWDAFYDAVANVVTAYYIADDSILKLESIDINPSTYTASAPTVLSTTFGAAGSTNTELRIARGPVDERRLVIDTANLSSGAVKSLVSYVDLTGNVAPNAPSQVAVGGFDATNAQAFAWGFGDPNPLDTQTAYEFQVQRVSDSVNVVATGTVTSAAQTYTVAANVLANGINYRWRVRTSDALGTVGAWSAYSAFTTSALGTLTVSDPAADTSSLNVATYNIKWTYVQTNGYTQTQRRVRVIRVSDSAVLGDTTMQASTVTNYTVNLPTDVPVRIEVSIVTNAPGTPTVGPATRLITSSYSSPMQPFVSLVAGLSYIAVSVTNPVPTGSQPAAVRNIIDRKATGTTTWAAIASVAPNSTYNDHAVASGTSYDYRARAETT
jgi:hypothetical protein